jgi:predicted proteasome-type protease
VTLQEWKDRARVYSTTVGCPDDLWDEDDPYQLKNVAVEAHAAGTSPEEFVRDVFADDLAASEGDELDFNNSLLYSGDE